MALKSICLQFETNMSSGSKIINVSYNLSVQRIMVKTTGKSDRSSSAIFCVIVYSYWNNSVCVKVK